MTTSCWKKRWLMNPAASPGHDPDLAGQLALADRPQHVPVPPPLRPQPGALPPDRALVLWAACLASAHSWPMGSLAKTREPQAETALPAPIAARSSRARHRGQSRTDARSSLPCGLATRLSPTAAQLCAAAARLTSDRDRLGVRGTRCSHRKEESHDCRMYRAHPRSWFACWTSHDNVQEAKQHV